MEQFQQYFTTEKNSYVHLGGNNIKNNISSPNKIKGKSL